MKTSNFYLYRIENLCLNEDGEVILTLAVSRGKNPDYSRAEERITVRFCEWGVGHLVDHFAKACNKRLENAINTHQYRKEQMARSAAIFDNPKG